MAELQRLREKQMQVVVYRPFHFQPRCLAYVEGRISFLSLSIGKFNSYPLQSPKRLNTRITPRFWPCAVVATQIFLRLATGAPLQALVRNDGPALPYSQGTPVSIGLPADALRVLPDPGVSVAEIRDETLGDQLLDLTSAAPTSS